MTVRSRRLRDERGASAVELALYMPLLLLVILLAVQSTLVFLGNQAASAVARETARVARATGDIADARRNGSEYAENIGKGVLEGYKIEIVAVGNDKVRVTVTGHAQEILPFGVPEVSQTVEGPIERFVETG